MNLQSKPYEDMLLIIKSNTHCFSLLTSLIRRPLRSRQASLLFVLSICAPMALSIEPNPIKINTNHYLIIILFVQENWWTRLGISESQVSNIYTDNQLSIWSWPWKWFDCHILEMTPIPQYININDLQFWKSTSHHLTSPWKDLNLSVDLVQWVVVVFIIWIGKKPTFYLQQL